MDLVCITRTNPRAVALALSEMQRDGCHVFQSGVQCWRSRSVKIAGVDDVSLDLIIDGEVGVIRTPVEVHVMPRALRILN